MRRGLQLAVQALLSPGAAACTASPRRIDGGSEFFRSSINRPNLFYEVGGLFFCEGDNSWACCCHLGWCCRHAIPPFPPLPTHPPGHCLPSSLQVCQKPASAAELVKDIAGWVAEHYPDGESGIV